MPSKPHPRWQKTKEVFRLLWQIIQYRRSIAVGILVALFALTAFTLAVYAFGWNWTGFNGGYDKVTVTSTAHVITTTTERPQTRTLWDWLSLLINVERVKFYYPVPLSLRKSTEEDI